MIIKFFITAIFILCFVLPLNATTLTVNQTFYGDDDVRVYYNGDWSTGVDAGELRVKLGNSNQFLPAFCVDFDTPLSVSDEENTFYTFENSFLPSYKANGNYVEWLMDYSLSSALRLRTFENNYAGAGLQLAIWEVLYDFLPPSSSSLSPYNLSATDGIFRYDVSTTDPKTDVWYNHYIEHLKAKAVSFSYTSSGNYKVVDLYNYGGRDDRQDLLIAVVPEPTTLMLLSFGLLGLSAVGRRKNS